MESPVNKVAFITGLSSALIGYSFWGYLWNDAFYHFISVSFVCYTFIIHRKAKSLVWQKLTFFGFVAASNALMDEIKGTANVFDWSEYISILVVLIYIFVRKK